MEKLDNVPWASDPERGWERKNYDEGKLDRLSPRRRAELETDRDLEKPVEQLVCDVHEETHDPNRSPLENIAGAQKRMVSMMARVAISNQRIATKMFWLTIAIATMTAVILLFAVATWISR